MAETGGHLVRNILSVRNVDLNTLTNVGVYACEITDSTEQHSPVEGEALVEVLAFLSGGERKLSQEIRSLSDFSRYTRTFDETWSAWTELAEGDGGGGGGVGTDLDFVRDDGTVTVRSNSGTDAVLPGATSSLAGVLTAATFNRIEASEAAITEATAKLEDIEPGAQVNPTGEEIVEAINTALGSEVWQGVDGDIEAENVLYDNTSSGLSADNVQAAIDELKTDIDATVTNLTVDRTDDAVTVESSSGTDAEIAAASETLAGVMSAADKAKLNAIEAGAQVNVPANLSVSRNASTVTVASDTGTNAVIPAANTSNAGVLSASDKQKLDSIESGATGDMSGAEIVAAIDTQLGSDDWQTGGGGGGAAETNLSVTNSTTTVTIASDTGDDAIIGAADASNAGIMSAAQAAKLAGIAAGAEVNVPTNLSTSRDATSMTINSDTGTDVTLSAASTSNAGVMSAADKTKLDGIETGATADMTGSEISTALDGFFGNTNWRGAGVTNLTTSRNASTATINSDTGTDATVPAADASNAGVMTASMFTKLTGIETGATADMSAEEILAAIDGALGSTEWRNAPNGDASTNASARVATTGNIVIATALNAGDTIDGVTLAEGDVVLVKAQTNATQNGVYVAGVSPARDERYDTFAKLAGLLVTIQEGSTHDDQIWLCTSASGGTIGADNVVFVETAVTPTNLTASRNGTSVTINSSTGTGAAIAAADATNAGVMTAAQATKLAGITAGAGITDITIARTSTTVTVESSDGTDGTINAADASNAGVMTASMYTKLNGIEANATGDQSAAEIIILLNSALGGTTWQAGGSSYTHPNHTGDVTSVADGVTTIGDSKVTTAKIANLAVTDAKIASNTITETKIANGAVPNHKLADMAANLIKGRIGSGGTPQDLTAAQVRTILNVTDGANKYSHPNHTGDVTSSGDGATTIAANAVTNTKLADMTPNTLKGRIGTTGDPQDLTPAQVRTMLNVVEGATAYTHPNHTGDVTSVGDGVTTIRDNKVTTAKIANVAVTEAKLATGAVTETKLAGNAVTEAKILNGAVANHKLATMTANTIKGRISSDGQAQDLTPAQVRSMIGVEAGATADQTGAEMVSAIDGQLGNTTWRTAGTSGGLSNGFRAVKNASQNIAEASGLVRVLWQTELQDANGNFASNRWTPGSAGIVVVGFSAAVSLVSGGGGTGSAFYLPTIVIRKNGSTALTSVGGANVSGAQVFRGYTIDVCTATDFYEIWAEVKHANTAPTMSINVHATNTIFYGAYLI